MTRPPLGAACDEDVAAKDRIHDRDNAGRGVRQNRGTKGHPTQQKQAARLTRRLNSTPAVRPFAAQSRSGATPVILAISLSMSCGPPFILAANYADNSPLSSGSAPTCTDLPWARRYRRPADRSVWSAARSVSSVAGAQPFRPGASAVCTRPPGTCRSA